MLLAAAALGVAVRAGAETAVVEGMTWTFEVADGEATVTRGPTNAVVSVPAELGGCPVTSIGPDAFASCGSLASVDFPDGLQSIGDHAFGLCGLREVRLPDSLTSLGARAFEYCRGLSKAYLPAGLEEVGTGAFAHCTGMEELTLDPANEAFEFVDGVLFTRDRKRIVCYPASRGGTYAIPDGVEDISGAFAGSGVIPVAFPDSLREIGEHAFDYCTQLGDLDLPGSVERIADNAFFQAYGLRSVRIPGSVVSIGNRAFANCGLTNLALAEGLGEIGDHAFVLGQFTGVSLPESVTNFGVGVFERCYWLLEPKLPSTMTELPSHMFNGCFRLESVEFPAGIASIGDSAFSECRALVDVELPASLEDIGSYAFSYCSKLASIVIPDGVKRVGDYAFASCGLTNLLIGCGVESIGGNAFADCTGLTEVALPDGLLDLGGGAFARCSQLRTAPLPCTLTNLGNAFLNCTSLESMVVPDGVDVIRAYAFYGCTNLTNLVLGSGVRQIEAVAFEDCSALKTLTIPERVRGIEMWAFHGCTALETLYLPARWSLGGFGERMLSEAQLPETCAVIYYGEVPTETFSAPIPVPYEWLDREAEAYVHWADGDYEEVARWSSENGMPVWECYLAGISPTNETAQFSAKVEFRDGRPVVVPDPNLGDDREYTYFAKKSLLDDEWTPLEELPDILGGEWRFFCVGVAMPGGDGAGSTRAATR